MFVCLLVILSGNALAQLARVGPVDRNNGFPQWYQDSTGLVLDACLPNSAELADGTCLVTPDQLASPASAISFPNNFPDEFFFFNASSTLDVNGGRALLVLALEGAFLNGPVVAGDQMVFARLRIRVDVPAPGGTYRVIHPFGVEEFPDLAPGLRSINFTNDVGLIAGDFGGALNGRITTFLRASATAGGPASPLVILNGGNTFLTDPNLTTPITGSPFGTNVFRIEGPNIGGPGIDFIETDQFTLMGRVHLAPVPSPVDVTRATYRRTPSAAQADVFATATPAIGVPNPVLSITGVNTLGTMMTNQGSRYYGQAQLRNPYSIPASLLITNSADSPVTFTEADVVDEVQISAASWDPSTHVLSVQAASGDLVMPPTLMALGFGQLDGMGSLSVQTPVPPAEVTVASSWGGRDTRKVVVGAFSYNANAPYAADDMVMGDLPADVSSTLNILANDLPNMGVTPRILANPLHGTVTIDLTGTAIYTPAAAYSGPDSFTYINNSGGIDSNVATVSFNVAFVNHPPLANPDSASASVTTAVTIDVLANDRDPDAGDTIDPLTVTIVTPPASGFAVPNPNGSITFSPGAGSSGNVTFAYTVSDSHGAASNPATVTVTVLAPDNLVITLASFRTGSGEWRIRGTSSFPGPGNTITIHNGPNLTSPVLGTIAVDAVGAFDFRLKNSTITPGPTRTISIESTKGGQVLAFPLTVTN